MNLNEISDEQLIIELARRKNVRSMTVNKNEYVKSQVHLSGSYDDGTRYLKAHGPVVILEITKGE